MSKTSRRGPADRRRALFGENGFEETLYSSINRGHVYGFALLTSHMELLRTNILSPIGFFQLTIDIPCLRLRSSHKCLCSLIMIYRQTSTESGKVRSFPILHILAWTDSRFPNKGPDLPKALPVKIGIRTSSRRADHISVRNV